MVAVFHVQYCSKICFLKLSAPLPVPDLRGLVVKETEVCSVTCATDFFLTGLFVNFINVFQHS